jgi:hypothetical protein
MYYYLYHLQVLTALALGKLDMPQLFIIVPMETSIWSFSERSFDTTALYTTSVKLYFICEASMHPIGNGFVIKQPKV